MSGRWLYHTTPPRERGPHVHARLEFEGGGELWFEDPRRFGLLRLSPPKPGVADPALTRLGPDPIEQPPRAEELQRAAHGLKRSVKEHLLDQSRIAGIGNIYASEILHRASVDPRKAAGAVRLDEWTAVAHEISAVLGEAIDRMGTTFSMYRTVWGESGGYGDQLRVYDRAGEACRACGGPIRRIVQGQRSTFFCPRCQAARPTRTVRQPRSKRPARKKPPSR